MVGEIERIERLRGGAAFSGRLRFERRDAEARRFSSSDLVERGFGGCTRIFADFFLRAILMGHGFNRYIFGFERIFLRAIRRMNAMTQRFSTTNAEFERSRERKSRDLTSAHRASWFRSKYTLEIRENP